MAWVKLGSIIRSKRLVGAFLLACVLVLQLIHLSNSDALRLISRLDYLIYDARFALLPLNEVLFYHW